MSVPLGVDVTSLEGITSLEDVTSWEGVLVGVGSSNAIDYSRGG